MNVRNIIIIVVLILIIIIMYNFISTGIELNRLNYIYKDINVLDERIAFYYLNNGKLPTEGENIEFSNTINPNDNEYYFEINLEELENVNLNYGKKQYGDDDIYIINEQSHTIYYLRGIEYKNVKYYTRDLNYEEIILDEYK